MNCSDLLKRGGVVACLVFCAACAQVALVSVTPVIAVLALELDQDSARELIELEKKKDWPAMLRLARALVQREPGRAKPAVTSLTANGEPPAKDTGKRKP